MLQMKRIYEEVSSNDGKRILVDRLWPRGVSKEDAQLDEWPKEITPSNTLRKTFHDGELAFDEFSTEYKDELQSNEEAKAICKEIAEEADDNTVTLLYASKNEEENHVLVLKDFIESIS